jgi:glutathione synthase/RimK-type ligase-like ATP-grasp enzyme
MSVRIAIHNRPDSWSVNWLEYCRSHEIDHEVVNCYDCNIMTTLRRFDGLLWHFDHWLGEDLLMARHVLMAAEHIGLAVFPNAATCWHFDDKLAQKYLLEAVGAPLAPTYAFFRQEEAVEWLRGAAFPLVAKLRRGAGSYNVRLLRDFGQAVRYCKRAFGRGFSPVQGYLADIGTKARKVRTPGDVVAGIKRAGGFFRSVIHGRRTIPPERGYVLFQDFLPGNTFDTRIAVVGNRAWGFSRNVRPGDWRASGSGSINYRLERIDLECVRIAFATAAALQTQSLCFDFVRSPTGQPLIVEMSYAYEGLAVYNCPGYWDRDLNWHEGHVWPEHAVLDDFLAHISRRKEAQPGRAEVQGR